MWKRGAWWVDLNWKKFKTLRATKTEKRATIKRKFREKVKSKLKMKVFWWLIENKRKVWTQEKNNIKENQKSLHLITLHLQTLNWILILTTAQKKRTTLIFLRRYKIFNKGGKHSKMTNHWFPNFLTKKLKNSSLSSKERIG